MDVRDKIYINGAWVPSTGSGTLEVIDSATEEVFATIPDGTPEDVDKAVQAAAAAFPGWAATSREERGKLLKRIGEALAARTDELANVISHEVGMPMTLSGSIQVGLPAGAFADAANAAESFPWEEELGNSLVVREPVGVVGAITPWNYPLYQVVLKVAPALAAGNTVVLKPSEVAPINAFVLADVIDEVGLPPGVFNLVSGTGPVVGEAIAQHPKVDMVSFTGSTRAGRRVMELAAEGIKRVSLELGGKSANILLDDADLATAVPAGVFGCYLNSGQTCSALSRACSSPATSWPRWRSWRQVPRRASLPATPSRPASSSARSCRVSSVTGCAATSTRASRRGPSSWPAAPMRPRGSRRASTYSRPCSPR